MRVMVIVKANKDSRRALCRVRSSWLRWGSTTKSW